MAPILHLSIPVRDLAEARSFYAEVLGCPVGRTRESWVDVWFYGLQLTLQARPDTEPAHDRTRHFGVTLPGDEFDALLARLRDQPVRWLSPPTTDDAGSPREQTKAMLLDPSGNAIELKTYPDPEHALGMPAAVAEPDRPVG